MEPAECRGVRRVVTGHDPDGRATVASDTRVEGYRPALSPGLVSHWLWKAEHAATFPDDGAMTSEHLPFFPGVGGYGFAIIDIPPTAAGEPLQDAALDRAREDYELHRPGALAYNDDTEPGMHATDTVDMCVVVAGELVLDLGDGVEAVLGAGDTVVQNGTRHRWRNRTDRLAVLAVVFVGAHRRDRPRAGGPSGPASEDE